VLAIRGRVVLTPAGREPYKVVLEHEALYFTEHPVATVRDGERLIQQSTPMPPERCTLHDHPVQMLNGAC
jgi:hypothetical protein